MRSLKISTTLKVCLTPVRMARTNKTAYNTCWRGYVERGTFIHYWQNYKLVQPIQTMSSGTAEADLHCWPARHWNHLEDTHVCKPVRVFSRRPHCVGKTHHWWLMSKNQWIENKGESQVRTSVLASWLVMQCDQLLGTGIMTPLNDGLYPFKLKVSKKKSSINLNLLYFFKYFATIR